MVDVSTPQVTHEDEEQLTRTLGIEAGGKSLSIGEMRDAVEAEADPAFASLGESTRRDLEGELDADLLERELENIVEQVARLPSIREVGIPDGDREPEVLYRAVAEPGWRVYEHLLDVGFFDSVDVHSPRFSSDHIRHTAQGLVESETLTDELADAGFDEREQTVLMMNVTNNDDRLARWVPTAQIPDGVEFNVEDVPPLQQRAMGGALLWIQTLDVHLWQKQVLITETILDDAVWDVKAMLGGLYLLTRAALEIADGGTDELTDSQATAALTAGTAIAIINQQEICRDAYRITDEMRAPSEVR
ncbi:hypothetical protein [Halomarina litorea]|uniref:hypothetical protein n=1 Tax=Halomarina litorea TaxID=2961595 RepID=UPI0020C30D3D|nr:hypothetical protein [Halomarina sp. BCD28]